MVAVLHMDRRVTDSAMRLNTESHCAFVDMVSLKSFLFGLTCTNQRRGSQSLQILGEYSVITNLCCCRKPCAVGGT
jgi:hypothetical protein